MISMCCFILSTEIRSPACNLSQKDYVDKSNRDIRNPTSKAMEFASKSRLLMDEQNSKVHHTS
jgi:hypothetical protein